jgi:prevent-host-death family protein
MSISANGSATNVYMDDNAVGIRELRQNLSAVLKRVEAGERLVVTDRNKPVALLVPVPEDPYDRAVAEGRIIPAKNRSLDVSKIERIKLKDGMTTEKAIDYVRGRGRHR